MGWFTRRKPKAVQPSKAVPDDSPVTALKVGDLIDAPTMLDLVVHVDQEGDELKVYTNSGLTRYGLSDRVKAQRRVQRRSTGEYFLVPVK